MRSGGRIREEVFNIALGEALRETRAEWRESPDRVKIERTDVLSGPGNAGKRPDILILDPHSPPCVVECSYDPADADRDAAARLGMAVKSGRREIRTAISVHVPASFQCGDCTKDDLSAGACIRTAAGACCPGPCGHGKAGNRFGRC